MAAVTIILGIIEAGVFVGLMWSAVSGRHGKVLEQMKQVAADLSVYQALLERMKGLYAQMVDLETLRKSAETYRTLQESLKAERGRITITSAELETVEVRLRELEEIERELEASALETKEELNILTKKREDLAGRNSNLREELDAKKQQIDDVMQEIEMSTQMQEQVDAMKNQLLQSQQQVDTVLLQLEQGNDQYYILKRRYDALDIEYAQLYEKFSETETAKEG